MRIEHIFMSNAESLRSFVFPHMLPRTVGKKFVATQCKIREACSITYTLCRTVPQLLLLEVATTRALGALHAPNLQTLILRAPAASLQALLASTPQLQTLKLHHACPVPETSIQHVAGWLNLQHLDCQPVIQPSCYSLFSRMEPNLRSLVLRCPQGFSGPEISYLLQHLSNLESASFSCLQEVDMLTHDELARKDRDTVLLKLTRLSLLLPADQPIDLAGLEFPALSYLSLTSNVSLHLFESTAEQLQELEMIGVRSR